MIYLLLLSNSSKPFICLIILLPLFHSLESAYYNLPFISKIRYQVLIVHFFFTQTINLFFGLLTDFKSTFHLSQSIL